MKRKEFIKKAGLLTAGVIGVPYILPTGRLFAGSGTRICNHVVLCMFAGGVRNIETVQKAEGNLLPNLLPGNETITSDIAALMNNLPKLGNPLSQYGTLYKNFRYNSLLAGHYQGNTVALTGAYVDNFVSFNDYTPKPSIFEFYHKHNSTTSTAKNNWWISNSPGENELLSHSLDNSYGAKYAANFLCPNIFIPNNGYKPVDLCSTFSSNEKKSADELRTLLNNNFNTPVQVNTNFNNSEQDRIEINNFVDLLLADANAGMYADPWGTGFMSGDMYNVYFAERVIKQFKPEFLCVNMTDVDTCHANFSNYCVNLNRADYAAAHLWQTIQNTPGMKDDTIMIIVPEHGRDGVHNTITDAQGRKGIDHGGDNVSKEIFCMVLGPSNMVYQNNIINNVEGESIDIVPTIANILGFLPDIPSNYLNGKVLKSALK
ncbi:MAG: hypothetical protein SGJ10_08300 [Bacteroidota bacterium]|nr:hypothetical protein [Bacteroidota bacterium]